MGRQAAADDSQVRGIEGADLRFLVGAGEGNRTLMTSLEGWGSAIELRPRSGVKTRSPPGEHRQRTRKEGPAPKSNGRRWSNSETRGHGIRGHQSDSHRRRRA